MSWHNPQIWCAAGVNLAGGRTRDGGAVVGASVFYDTPQIEGGDAAAKDDVDRLDKELKVRNSNCEINIPHNFYVYP